MVKPTTIDNKSAAFRKEQMGRLLEFPIILKRIMNVGINTSTFTEIISPIAAKALLVKPNTYVPWIMSLEGTGDSDEETIRITAPISFDIAARPNETLFYAKAITGDDTLEILFMD